MRIEQGVTYWGMNGSRQVERRVENIETRSSGTRYVNWTNKKKDGRDGVSSWTPLNKFKEWVKGIYEIEPNAIGSTETLNVAEDENDPNQMDLLDII